MQRTIVRVDRLRLPLFIGILDHEREQRQTVEVSIEMTVEIPDHPNEVDANYVSYAPIVDHLLNLSRSERHIDLVEELANEIFEFLFDDHRVRHVRVDVMKPEIYPQAEGVGVRMERDNPA